MRKNKIRILHVAQAAGGVDRYIRMLLKYLDKEKFENILVCSQDFHEEDYRGLADSFEQVEMTRAIGGNDLKAIREVRALIKKYNPNIVYADQVDFVVHLASNTHPVAYATDPIGTVTANIIGTNNLLKFAVKHHAERFAFASSNEIYGENRGDVEFFDERYCGYIDSNTLRAGYPESKRCGEALCQAYKQQENLDVVIPRFTRSYGPTMLKTDTKAISQFIKKAVDGDNIALKSTGTQYYSYTYVADAVAGFLTVILKGESGEAYNIADEASDIMLKDLAKIIADFAGKEVVFELPDETEKAGYSKATKARLDGSKLKKLGWTARYDIKQGLERTMKMLTEISE